MSLPSDVPHTLAFRLVGDKNNNNFTTVTLDNVYFVPVPAAAVLGGIGLALAGWQCRRRAC